MGRLKEEVVVQVADLTDQSQLVSCRHLLCLMMMVMMMMMMMIMMMMTMMTIKKTMIHKLIHICYCRNLCTCVCEIVSQKTLILKTV